MGNKETKSKGMEMTVPIELATTEELLSELFKRFDHAVFLSDKKVTGELDERDMQFKCNELATVGLLRWGILNIEGGFYDDRNERSVDL